MSTARHRSSARTRAAAAALLPAPLLALLLALLAGCATHERGYYAPAGAELGDTLASQRQAGPDIVIDVACQGVYVNRVRGVQVASVHVQLGITRPRAGDLTLRRGDLVADVQLSSGGPRVSLPLSEAWSRRDSLTGDLTVPAWTRRPFDLFFDTPMLLGEPPPESVLLRWAGEAAGEDITGQCLFRRIPPDDNRLPLDGPIQDMAFGVRNGYYLPGTPSFGTRALRASSEERLHYIFHDPDAWEW